MITHNKLLAFMISEKRVHLTSIYRSVLIDSATGDASFLPINYNCVLFGKPRQARGVALFI